MKLPTILLVEDNADDRFLALRALKKAGLTEVHLAEDGQAAVDYLRGVGKYSDRTAFPMPEVALIDLKLPELDGHQVLEWIDSREDLNELHAYVLSSSGEQRDQNQAKAAHAVGYFIKPLSAENIVEMLKKLESPGD